MLSFDVVSEFDMLEATNAVDQANREITNRFDFKGSNARIEQDGASITLKAPAEFQLAQMLDILRQKVSKRGIDVGCMKVDEPQMSGSEARQVITLRSGLDADLAKKIVRMIKDGKHKVQTSIQGDKVRVSGKKRDDLQTIIALLREAKLDLPLQYENFRD